MQIIIALGNPGTKYEKNRHNAGWLAADFILKGMQDISEQEKFKSIIKEARFENGKALFVYPQTFMNASGEAVQELLSFYKLAAKDILVLHDEVDLPLGTIKFTENSGSAGHNGIKSLIDSLGTQEFRRIRIGVETRTDKSIPPTEDFVLQNFSAEEIAQIPFEQIKARVLLELKPKM